MGEHTDLKRVALKSASKLAQVQIITMVLGLAVRVVMPRTLGVDSLGLFYFAEAFPVLYFAFLGCGIDAYIRKTLPARPEHTGEVMWTLIVFLLALAGVIALVLFGSLRLFGYDGYTTYLVMVMGGSAAFSILHRMIMKQVFLSLHDYKIAANVELAVKVFFTVSMLLVLWIAPRLGFIVWIAFIAEGAGALWLFRQLVKRKMIIFKIDLALLKHVLLTSFPFLAVTLFQELYANIDAAMLKTMAGNAEVGYYGAATRLKGVFLLLLPVLANSLMPLMAETYAKARDKYLPLVRDAIRAVMMISFFLATTLMVFADIGTHILYGADFEPAARVVAYLAPLVPITYVAVLIAVHLTVCTTGKAQAAVQAACVGGNALLNVWMIPWGTARWGVGGAGVGTSFASLITQAAAVVALMFVTRKDLNLMDGRMLRLVIANVVAFAAILWGYDEIMTLTVIPRIGAYVPIAVAYGFLTGLITRNDLVVARDFVRARLGRGAK